MDTLGVITARAGSKSIPRKNLQKIRDISLVGWTLASAIRANLDRLVVSTDDPEVAAIATQWRVEVLMRPAHLAEDDTPDWPVFDHVLRELGIPGDSVVVHLRPTSPFRQPEEIREVAASMVGAYDTVRSVRPIIAGHPCKAYLETSLFFGATRIVPATNHHQPNHPRQRLPKAWAAAGFIDAVKAEVILNYRRMEGAAIRAWPVPADRAFDLDTAEDLERANRLAEQRGWLPGRVTT